MGRIVDRSKEHLGATDIPAVSGRRLLLKMARDLQAGIEPAVAQNPQAYRLRAIDVVSEDEEFDDLLSGYDAELGVARF